MAKKKKQSTKSRPKSSARSKKKPPAPKTKKRTTRRRSQRLPPARSGVAFGGDAPDPLDYDGGSAFDSLPDFLDMGDDPDGDLEE